MKGLAALLLLLACCCVISNTGTDNLPTPSNCPCMTSALCSLRAQRKWCGYPQNENKHSLMENIFTLLLTIRWYTPKPRPPKCKHSAMRTLRPTSNMVPGRYLLWSMWHLDTQILCGFVQCRLQSPVSLECPMGMLQMWYHQLFFFHLQKLRIRHQ